MESYGKEIFNNEKFTDLEICQQWMDFFEKRTVTNGGHIGFNNAQHLKLLFECLINYLNEKENSHDEGITW